MDLIIDRVEIVEGLFPSFFILIRLVSILLSLGNSSFLHSFDHTGV